MKVGREQESVLNFENAKQDLKNLNLHQKTFLEKEVLDQKILSECKLKVTEADKKLKELQSEVKALGEDKLIKIQGSIAGQFWRIINSEKYGLLLEDKSAALKICSSTNPTLSANMLIFY